MSVESIKNYKTKNIFHSIKIGIIGLFSILKSEKNARYHLLITGMVCVYAVLQRFNSLQWGLIIVAISLVWLSECFNTCIEAICDLISQDESASIKLIKDISAAAVLISCITALILWCVAVCL